MTSTWVIENKLWVNEDNFYKYNGDGTGILLVPANTVVPWPILIICCLFTAMLGAIITGMIIDLNSFGSNAINPVSYTDKELNQYSIVDKTIATEIKLIIAPKEKIQSLMDKNTFAVSFYEKPCSIYIPTDMMIRVYPSIKKAEWIDQWEGNVLAHEIMHCIRGKWHG